MERIPDDFMTDNVHQLGYILGTDPNQPTYVAIKGSVFDVSGSPNYGPGGPYHGICFSFIHCPIFPSYPFPSSIQFVHSRIDIFLPLLFIHFSIHVPISPCGTALLQINLSKIIPFYQNPCTAVLDTSRIPHQPKRAEDQDRDKHEMTRTNKHKMNTVFAGKDASRALALSSTKPDDVRPEYEDLSDKAKSVLEEWFTYFSKRYNIVGKLQS